MVFERNQIKDLFILVHPDWGPYSTGIISKWRSIVERIAQDDTQVLVQTNMWDRERRISNLTTNREKPQRDLEHLSDLENLEKEAKGLLGDRYRVFSRMFMSREVPEDIDWLRQTFNVEFTLEYNPWKEVLFEKIIGVGLRPSVCLWTQLDELKGLSQYRISGGADGTEFYEKYLDFVPQEEIFK